MPRSIAKKLTGDETQSVYGRYEIVDEAAPREGVEEPAAQI